MTSTSSRSDSLVRAGWRIARRRAGLLDARKDEMRMIVRGSDLVTRPSELEITATGPDGPVYLAACLAESFGLMRVSGSMTDLRVPPGADPEAILRAHLAEVLEQARAILERARIR